MLLYGLVEVDHHVSGNGLLPDQCQAITEPIPICS